MPLPSRPFGHGASNLCGWSTPCTDAAQPATYSASAALPHTSNPRPQARPVTWPLTTGVILGVLLAVLVKPGPAQALQAQPFMLQGYSSTDLFAIQSLSLLSWVFLLLFPRWKLTRHVALVAPLIQAVLYTLVMRHLLLPALQSGANSLGMDFTSLAGIVKAFANKDAVFAGWLHYCAFDPLVGLCIVLDSQRLGIHHLLVVPCILLTMVAGPAGFLLYMVLRTVARPRGQGRSTLRRFLLDE